MAESLFAKKSSRSPTISKVSMERMVAEINKAKPLKTKAETDARDAKIIMKHLRSTRGTGSLFTGRGK